MVGAQGILYKGVGEREGILNGTLQGEITGCTELLGNITLVTRTLSGRNCNFIFVLPVS